MRLRPRRGDAATSPEEAELALRGDDLPPRAASLAPVDVLALQRAIGNRAVAQFLGETDEPPDRLIQRDHKRIAGEKYQYEDEEGDVVTGTSVWAISDDLSVNITIDGEEMTIPPADIHSLEVGLPPKGNLLYGGLTVVHQQGEGVKATTTRFDFPIEPKKYEGFGVLHSEPTYFFTMLKAAVSMLEGDAVHAVILEIRQSNTPCAACQKIMASAVAKIEDEIGKPIIIRGSARQIYESAPGKLGTALHSARGQELPERGPPNVDDVHGIHAIIP